VCTPLTPDLDVDVASLIRLVDVLLDAGVHGLFVLGSTSEVAFLPDEHRQRVLDSVIGHVAGQVPVLAGAIDMTTPRVIAHARDARKAGADGIVATAPFYTRTHPAEITRHYRLVGEAVDLPLYAYDLPVSVHTKLAADLLLDLAADEVLAGVKDSSGDDGALRGLLLGARRRGLSALGVFTGSELTVDNALRMGVHGVVPGLGNVDPRGYVRLYEHCIAGNWDAAAREQDRLAELYGLVDAGDPERMGRGSSALGAFKAALHLLGVIDCPVTAAPQIPLADNEIDRVRAHLAAAGL
jgi:4-hydroxy-tetrahydrodipicolinate synthase